MNRLLTTLCTLSIALCAASAIAQDRAKDAKDKKDKAKEEAPLPPELATLKKEAETWSTDKLRLAIASERASITEWARKNNFNPPGDEFDGDKNNVARKGRPRDRVSLGKRKEAELLAQFQPRKARFDVLQAVLRDRDAPRKDERPHKEK
jgi:hypothetical protein